MPIIIAIDTVERLFYDNPDNVNNPEYDISWLFGKPGARDTTGLLYTIPSVLWVLCGRDRLNDEVLPGEFQFKLERLDRKFSTIFFVACNEFLKYNSIKSNSSISFSIFAKQFAKVSAIAILFGFSGVDS